MSLTRAGSFATIASLLRYRRHRLADGNALVLSTQRLVPILDALDRAFPNLERVGIYANAQDILRKSEEELATLYRKKLGMIYMGLESGDEEILRRVKKGATAVEMIEAVKKAQAVGLRCRSSGFWVWVGVSFPRDTPSPRARRSAPWTWPISPC
jgi:hypothetical protein